MGVAGTLTGCRQSAPPAPPLVRGSVNIQALLPLHPGWNEVLEMDRLIAHVAGLPAVPPVASIPMPEAKFPAPMAGEIDSPPTAAPPQVGTRRAASERIARLRVSLDEHSQRVLDRERGAMEKRLAAEVAVERSRLKSQAPPPIAARSPEDEKKLRKLEMRALALETQVHALFEPKLTEVQKELDDVAKQIQTLQAPPAVREEVQDARIEKEVEAFRATRQVAVDASLTQRAEQLKATANTAVQAYRTGTRNRLAEATPPPPVTAPKATPMPDAKLPSPSQVAAEVFRPAAVAPLDAAHRLSALRAQRARLAKVIMDDVTRRVEALAAQKRWALSPSGGADLTSGAADELRKQFSDVANGAVFH